LPTTLPNHITQRGTDRQDVFHSRSDRLTYLRLLREQAALGGLPILAYCLMNNHIHLIAAPAEAAALAEVMQRLHGRYAQYLNVRRGRCGHLWQNRFKSRALGPSHLWAALRYVERNPVRAGLAASPKDYEWSSAETHLSGQNPWRIADMHFWSEAGGIEAWRALLDEREDETVTKALRRATYSGQPFGNGEFVNEIRAQREAASRRAAADAAWGSGHPLARAAY
jgi:putative transposase